MSRRTIYLFFCLLLTMCGRETTDLQRNLVPADAAQLDITPGPVFQFDAQIVGNSTSYLFTVTNKGKKPALQLASDFYLSITFKYEGGYPGADGTCGEELQPGESCQLRVTFAPQYVGDFEQALRVSFFDGYSERVTDLPVLRGRGL